MKAVLLRIAVLLPALLTALMIAGCASLAGNGVLTLKQVHMDMSWKMTAYRQAVIAGSVTEGQAQQVNAAYHEYLEAYQHALDAAGGNLEAPAPPDLQAKANQLIDAISVVLATLT